MLTAASVYLQMRIPLLSLLVLMVAHGVAQPSGPFQELKAYVKMQPPRIEVDSTSYLEMFVRQKGNHYLLPLYKAFIQEQKGMVHDSAVFYESLAQAASFLGDQKTVMAYEKLYYEPLPDSSKTEIAKLADITKDISYIDAKSFIINRARKSRVLMINEAHDKPQTRVFTASLLEDLYQQGFRYLALEMLANVSSKAVLKVNAASGYYTAEPVAAELVRKALEIGYTLVPYEDTVAGHTINQREYAQAENLYNFLSKKDSTTKILVHAGYSHIEEGARNNERIPMAAYFKIISGIDPLTIDQTEMIEGGKDPYGAWLYEAWTRKRPVFTPSIPLLNEVPVDPFDINLYDIHIVHPSTKYLNERPVWAAMNGWRTEIPVSPAYRTSFLVQAFYDKEYNETNPGLAIPADQTYLNAANGIYYLYLRKGKYKILFRDKAYEILGTKDIVVN